MSSDRYASLAPASVSSTLRSLPRRYREVLRANPDLDIDALASVPTRDGHSLLDVVVDSARTLSVVQRALERTVVSDRPVLHRGVVDARARDWQVEVKATLATELDQFDATAEALAGRIDAVASGDWLRTATLTGGPEITALELAQEAARTGAENLRTLERVVAELGERA